MELPILKDKNIFPTNEVLADVLEASFLHSKRSAHRLKPPA